MARQEQPNRVRNPSTLCLTVRAGRVRVAGCAAALLLCSLAPVLAQQLSLPRAVDLQEVTIHGAREDLQGVAGSAGEGVVSAEQLRAQPIARAGDLAESVPGLVATQHSGEGKANQYFLRGFNLDHGTDFATYVDGMPVNLRTHAHGQGYTDLNFLIPELVEAIEYRKGPYHAQDGDFATAGGMRMRTAARLSAPFAQAEVGGFGYRRVLAAGSLRAGEGDLLLAAAQTHDDGPWSVAQDLRKSNLVARYTQGSARNGWSVGVNHHEARWNSTDQVPRRALGSGQIGRYDAVDPTDGGRTSRTALQGTWVDSGESGQTTFDLYALRYAFDLFSDFTYATRGCTESPLPPACNAGGTLDQFEQVDRRSALAVSGSRRQPLRIAGQDASLAYGVELHRDSIPQVALYDTQARQRLATVRNDAVRLDAFALWGRVEWQFGPRWRAIAGLRADAQAARVDSSLAANSGTSHAVIASPKLSLVHAPDARSDWYVNWGRGFHSNDVRGTVMRVDPRDGSTPVMPATPLARATGWELGSRRKWSDALGTTASLWWLDLDSELVFAGDAGTTEPARASRRRGLELTANWRPAIGVELDADLSLAHARYRDPGTTGDRIPGAMERVGALRASFTRGLWTWGLHARVFGSRPLIEDNSIRAAASTVVHLKGGYRLDRRTTLTLQVFNLFDHRFNDAEYAYASRLPGEPAFSDSATPSSLHVHPAPPRTVRLGIRFAF